ncbi:MAG TPA: hypothetical protein VJX16_11790 [Terriglobales bacterium]|nr:hypothetical protein [Terriglobales bacterium]
MRTTASVVVNNYRSHLHPRDARGKHDTDGAAPSSREAPAARTGLGEHADGMDTFNA